MENIGKSEDEILQKMRIIAYKEILSFKEAVLYLNVSESFLYKLTSKNDIPFSKPNGGKIYFKKEDLNKWMTQNSTTSIDELEKEILTKLKKGRDGKKIN
ncbi:helix-turn-helix domain-containing protein [Flavobacterium oreochromis]|uniref:Helix-turn-helix domain-containing protein n=1 Tax=Flavobacterium oreochromis TaxID=2906078 RepID=A0ABW8P8T4_9FLAO|nr:helix-turn-helix domain-containing protein [Flavobacterium oreochromis]OWP78543.1 hypothetical protein BWG23_01910 [Flavobacterium oreochromis]